ncbi:hypothetical protein [Rhodopirellula europaea]|uniref:hypothetical protein n=1 Tax=Rhodopirellula europaea TaxID=1263866 RepID=UPI003D29F9D8
MPRRGASRIFSESSKREVQLKQAIVSCFYFVADRPGYLGSWGHDVSNREPEDPTAKAFKRLLVGRSAVGFAFDELEAKCPKELREKTTIRLTLICLTEGDAVPGEPDFTSDNDELRRCFSMIRFLGPDSRRTRSFFRSVTGSWFAVVAEYSDSEFDNADGGVLTSQEMLRLAEWKAASDEERAKVVDLVLATHLGLALDRAQFSDEPSWRKATREAFVRGINRLTKAELRRLQTMVSNRLKEMESTGPIRERAIAEDIFPIANTLFPDRITSPSDVDAESLTALFKEKADDPESKFEPLSQEQLLAIKDLSQAWRKHFGPVELDGRLASVTSWGKRGLRYRTADKEQDHIDSGKDWPELIFRK